MTQKLFFLTFAIFMIAACARKPAVQYEEFLMVDRSYETDANGAVWAAVESVAMGPDEILLKNIGKGTFHGLMQYVWFDLDSQDSEPVLKGQVENFEIPQGGQKSFKRLENKALKPGLYNIVLVVAERPDMPKAEKVRARQ